MVKPWIVVPVVLLRGALLFNEQGEIVAMHNSWDSTTAMRHAVTQEALAEFLIQHRAELTRD